MVAESIERFPVRLESSPLIATYHVTHTYSERLQVQSNIPGLGNDQISPCWNNPRTTGYRPCFPECVYSRCIVPDTYSPLEFDWRNLMYYLYLMGIFFFDWVFDCCTVYISQQYYNLLLGTVAAVTPVNSCYKYLRCR